LAPAESVLKLSVSTPEELETLAKISFSPPKFDPLAALPEGTKPSTDSAPDMCTSPSNKVTPLVVLSFVPIPPET